MNMLVKTEWNCRVDFTFVKAFNSLGRLLGHFGQESFKRAILMFRRKTYRHNKP